MARYRRVCLLGWGSRGDVQPLVALGVAMQQVGFDVTVAAPRNLLGLVDAAGLPSHDFGIDMDQAIRSEVGTAWLVGGSRSRVREAKLMDAVVRQFAPLAAAGVQDLAYRYDALVSGMLTHDAALSVAEEFGLGHVLGLFAPMTPTASATATMFPVLKGRNSSVNRLGTALVQLSFRQLIRPPGDLARQQMGIDGLSTLRYRRLLHATPVLLGASPQVVPPPPQWGGRVAVTGYWVSKNVPPLSTKLQTFLDAGAAPIYLGFGSMPVPDPQARWRIIEAVIERCEQRAVVHFGGSTWRPEQLPAHIFIADDEPHARLFARVSAVVHHGGAGTTAAAVRAGVPQVVVPHIGDQPYWARRMHQLGVAAKPLPLYQLSVDTLTDRLCQLDDGRRRRAANLATRVLAEDGATTAARLLAQHWA